MPTSAAAIPVAITATTSPVAGEEDWEARATSAKIAALKLISAASNIRNIVLFEISPYIPMENRIADNVKKRTIIFIT